MPEPTSPLQVPAERVVRDPDTDAPLVWQDRERVSGEPCFYGTRIPVALLLQHLAADKPLSHFLHSFPDVSRETAQATLGLAARALGAHPRWPDD